MPWFFEFLHDVVEVGVVVTNANEANHLLIVEHADMVVQRAHFSFEFSERWHGKILRYYANLRLSSAATCGRLASAPAGLTRSNR